jgi:hypothetical protein
MRNEIEKLNPKGNSKLNQLKKDKVLRYLMNPEIAIPILESRLNSTNTGGLR